MKFKSELTTYKVCKNGINNAFECWKLSKKIKYLEIYIILSDK